MGFKKDDFEAKKGDNVNIYRGGGQTCKQCK